MAPTETLAEQHFLTLEPICAELGVRVSLQTGSVKHELEGAQILVGTHALIQEGVEAGRPGRGGDRRAAPLRSRAAARARGGALRPCAAHDGDADPAHARPDGVRRPRRDGDRPPAARSQAGRSRAGSPTSGAPRPIRVCAATSTTAARRTSSARSSRSRRRSRRAQPSRRPSAFGADELAGYRVGSLHGRLRPGGSPRADGRVQAR